MKLQRLAEYAAIAFMCVYIAFGVFGYLLAKRFDLGDLFRRDPLKAMAAYSAAPNAFNTAFVLGIAVCILLWIAVYVILERMQANAPHLSRIALIVVSVATAAGIAALVILTKIVGIIAPTQDIAAFRACNAVAAGLYSVSGTTLGWTSLLIGCAIFRTRAFSKVLGCLFLLAGVMLIPMFYLSPIYTDYGGIGNPIAAFLFYVSVVWSGIALLRQKQPQAAYKEMAASR